MLRRTGFVAGLGRSTMVAGAVVLAAILSCTESPTSPLAKPDVAAHLRSLEAQSAAYSVSAVPFEPEPAPATFLMAADDSVAYDTPIGFDFTFYGNTYSVLHVASNGLVGFDRTIGDGCCTGGNIPFAGDAPYNNLIAIAWTDLNSSAPNADIRYETRGSAPNRKFILQFNNVPQFFQGPGHVTAQLVLSEGSNDITLYTTSMDISGDTHEVTQGIENAPGTEAAFVPGRVRAFFTLSNDAVRFSPAAPNQAPVITSPANISFNTGTGVCSAIGSVGTATATDDSPGATVSGRRSDGLPLDAPYPKGATTITWTATDAGGLIATADQTVTVVDRENPSITAPADISADNDVGSAYATIAVGNATSSDNCPGVAVTGARNDGRTVSAPYPVGSTIVTWMSTDASGNTATATQTVTVRDVTPPSVVVPANMTLNAVAPGGARVTYSVGASDNVSVTSVSCTIPSGSVFPIGVTTTTCTASDAAANRASSAFAVTILGAHDQIENLIAYVSGLHLPNGTANPLLAQLQGAYISSGSGDVAGACSKLSSFISTVAKKSSSIPSAEANQMLGDSRRIMNVLGC